MPFFILAFYSFNFSCDTCIYETYFFVFACPFEMLLLRNMCFTAHASECGGCVLSFVFAFCVNNDVVFNFSQPKEGCNSYVKFWLTPGDDFETVCNIWPQKQRKHHRCRRGYTTASTIAYVNSQVKGVKASTLTRVNAFDPVFR